MAVATGWSPERGAHGDLKTVVAFANGRGDLKQVNEVLKEYGIGKVAVEAAGFVVRMNICRSPAADTARASGKENKTSGPVNGPVNHENADGNAEGGPVNQSSDGPVSWPEKGPERLFAVIKSNPGLRKAALADLSGLTVRTVKRYLESVLSSRIEFRGAPKTGGYYCKEP